ncbi:hypothetical protein CGC21_11550 [Leishmania donovani]|uniref:SPRY domain-containing protein n=1 Tax=Leishmania donovani TaxID=5661 RepID=A0A504X4Q3_LEIDO|nr:hypothetical protein CGC21_11550 [Leishmania donovani]
MSHPADLVTPPNVADNTPGGNGAPKNWRSTSAANSSSSYTRWRNSRRADASDRSLQSHSPAADGASTTDAEASTSSLPVVIQLSRDRKRDGRRSSSEQNTSTTSEARPLASVEERSFRSGLPGSAAPSHGELSVRGRSDAEERVWHPIKLKDGEDSARWSQTSLGAVSRRRGEVHCCSKPRDASDAAAIPASSEASELTLAIAEAVPRIAQEQASATEAYADRWSHELQQSTATEEELRHLYQQLEKELIGTRRAANTAEERHKCELELLKRQLEQERAERLKAEQDREDLLAQATMSPSHTPRTGGGLPSAEQSGDFKGRQSLGISPSNAYISDVFYDKLKEREERARARVRKEFVRQAQESLYAEQRKRAEAEKATEVTLKRLDKAEEDISKAQEALQEATSVLEAKDVQLHERAIHVQELEAQVHLLERQLAAAQDAERLSSELASKNLEEVKALADQRQAELEAQRQFVHQLQEKIGLTTLDLFDRENDQEGVLRTVHELRARCRQLEEEFAAAVQEATALLEQRRQRAEDEAQLLRGRNEELKQRCVTMGEELAELKTRLECDSSEVAQLRARNEKALSECHVEIRSLQLQLERVTEVAQRRSSESATAKEIEQQQSAALVRQYAAEARSVQEELDRLKSQSHREHEKHLTTVLDLSQQITALKQANTQLEHAINVRERESTDATRLLGRAREEVSQLREERRRMSAPFFDHREGSQPSSTASSYDALLRRIAELENVQKELTERLRVANSTVEQLQSMQQATADQPKSRRAPAGHHRRRRSKPYFPVPPTDSFLQMSDDEREKLQAGGHDVATAPLSFMGGSLMSVFTGHREPTASLLDLLESIVQQLESIIRCARQQGEPAVRRNSPTASPSPQEHQVQQFKQTEELEALDRVLVSCMAALECCHLRRTSSPFYSSFRDADRWLQHVQNHRDVAQHATSAALPQDHFPQIPLERPRRSSQRSRSSVGGDDEFLSCFSNTSAAAPHLPTERTARGGAAACVLQRSKQECTPAGKRLFDGSDAVQRIQPRTSASVSEGDREVLQSEPCWEGDADTEAIVQGEQVNTALASTKTPASGALGEVPASSGDAPVAAGSAASRTVDPPDLTSTPSPSGRTLLLQRRLEKDAEARARLHIVSDEPSALPDTEKACTRAKSTSSSAKPLESPDQTHARRRPAVSPRRAVNGAAAAAASSGAKGGGESDSGTPATLSVCMVIGETAKPAAAKPSAGATFPPTNGGKDAAAEGTVTTTPEVPSSINACDGSGALATPRRRYIALRPTMSVSPLTTASTRTLSSNDDNEEGSPAAPKRKVDIAHTAATAGSKETETYGTQGASTAPRRTDSGGASATVAALRGRLAAASGLSTTRTSTGSLNAGASAGSTADAKSAEAAALAELRELRQVLKDKERDLTRLTRDVEKATQAAAKAQKKTEDLQGKLESEKSAFAAHKKDTLAQRQELQRELRQAQAALRLAEQVQDKLQRELEKQKEKLATASSRATSVTTTPVMTPRSAAPSSASFDSMLQAKVSSLESEKKLMKDTIRQLEEKKEVLHLRQQLSTQETTVRDQRERLGALLEENKTLKAREKAERKPARKDAAAATLRTGAAPGKGVSEEQLLSVRSPRQAVTLATPEKEAMAHLREELTAAQTQVGEHKRMYEHAERRIKRLEIELAAVRRRAETAEAAKGIALQAAGSPASTTAATAIFKDTIASMKEQLASVTAECSELRQRARERTEEATTLQSALQEAEDDRDACVRQIRDLKSRASEAEEKAATALAAQKMELTGALEKVRTELRSVKAELRAAADSAQGHQEASKALRSQLGGEQQRCSDLEKEKRAAQEEAAAKAAAADASRQQADHYKKKTKQITKKLDEALRELAVLAEEYERICEERKVAAKPDTEKNAIAEARSVSRNLSDALLSANRPAPVTGATSTAWAIAALDQERQAREQLELDVLSLYSKISAIDHLEQKSWHSVERGGACAVAGASSTNLPVGSTHDRPRDPPQPPWMPVALQQIDSINVRGHATANSHQHAEPQQRSRSLPSEALQLSPGARSRGDAQSTYRGLSPRSMVLSTSTSAVQPYRSDSSASVISALSELPATSVYYSTRGAGSSGNGTGLCATVELQFSSSAGRLLLSKRGHRVQRPVFSAAANEASDLDVCCAAIGSVSHTIYASHMLAKGHYHLKHIFRFIVRVLSDCESGGGGDILIGFADRYIPMESFGAKRNALRYRGCYYLSLRNGGLFCPAQDICDATPECVARAGDEIACTLRTDVRSISYSWNGVECGVAFTEVSLSPSLYPCVEVNTSGGALELLGIDS